MKFQERLMFYPFNREETAISKTLRLWLVFAGEMFTLRGNCYWRWHSLQRRDRHTLYRKFRFESLFPQEHSNAL